MWKKFLTGVSIVFLASRVVAATISSDEALKELLDGNRRFAEGKSQHKKWEQEARQERSASQSPFAVILSCSDSRTPPELIFDQGLGDLFVVRVAGNVVGELELASIAYSVAHLNSPLIMVLGHEQCGAVKTALSKTKQVEELYTIYPLITQNIAGCKQDVSDPLKKAIFCNVLGSMRALQDSRLLFPFLKDRKVKIVGGYYDFHNGYVTLIPEPPASSRLKQVQD